MKRRVVSSIVGLGLLGGLFGVSAPPVSAAHTDQGGTFPPIRYPKPCRKVSYPCYTKLDGSIGYCTKTVCD